MRRMISLYFALIFVSILIRNRMPKAKYLDYLLRNECKNRTNVQIFRYSPSKINNRLLCTVRSTFDAHQFVCAGFWSRIILFANTDVVCVEWSLNSYYCHYALFEFLDILIHLLGKSNWSSWSSLFVICAHFQLLAL